MKKYIFINEDDLFSSIKNTCKRCSLIVHNRDLKKEMHQLTYHCCYVHVCTIKHSHRPQFKNKITTYQINNKLIIHLPVLDKISTIGNKLLLIQERSN